MDTSSAATLTLPGLNESRTHKYVVLAFTVQGYFLTLLLNLTLIAVVSVEKDLHQPMYVFLCNLCINGLYGTAGFYPKFMSDLLSDSRSVSYGGCLLQTFVIFSYALCEFTSLTAMAVDRYLAICEPLRYHTAMTPATTGKVLLFVWMLPCCSVACSVLLTANLPFCGTRVSTLYCKLTASTCDTETVRFAFNGTFACLLASMGLFVVYSYAKIFLACRRCKQKRSKFTQTCLPHIISFLNYVAVTVCDAFSVRFSGARFPQWFANFMSVAFLVTPPVLNPIIYGMKLSPIRTRLQKMWGKGSLKRDATAAAAPHCPRTILNAQNWPLQTFRSVE